jgi:hypothetical protein
MRVNEKFNHISEGSGDRTRRPTVSSLYNLLGRKPLTNNAQRSFQHPSERHPAMEI